MFVRKLKIYIYILLFLLILNFIVPIYAYALDKDSIYVWSNNSSSIETSTTEQAEDNLDTQNNTGNFLGITSGSACLMDQKTGTVLYEYNLHEQLRPASVTKIMTILLYSLQVLQLLTIFFLSCSLLMPLEL